MSIESEGFSKLRLKDLQLLQQIASTRSLTALADKRGMSQPAVSRALREIETSLGAQVFSRDKTARLQATPIGRRVLERVDLLMADAHALQSEVRAFEEGSGAHLRLGIIPFVSNGLMQGVLRELTMGSDAMSVSTCEASTDQLIVALRRQELDAVLGRLSVDPAADELHQERLFAQTASMVINVKCPLVKNTRPTLQGLCEYDWVLPPTASPTRLAFVEAFVNHGATPPGARVETTSARLIHSLIASNPRSLGLVPLDIGKELENWGGVKCIGFPVAFRMPTVGLITLARRRQLAAVRILRDVVHRTLANTPSYS